MTIASRLSEDIARLREALWLSDTVAKGIHNHLPVQFRRVSRADFQYGLRETIRDVFRLTGALPFPVVRCGVGTSDMNQEWDTIRDTCLPEIADSLSLIEPATKNSENAPESSHKTGLEATYSKDFSEVEWFGTKYQFDKPQQAKCVRVLWNQWGSGGGSLLPNAIGKRIESVAYPFRIEKVFRIINTDGVSVTHPAFGTMILRDANRGYRLVKPESQKTRE